MSITFKRKDLNAIQRELTLSIESNTDKSRFFKQLEIDSIVFVFIFLDIFENRELWENLIEQLLFYDQKKENQ